MVTKTVLKIDEKDMMTGEAPGKSTKPSTTTLSFKDHAIITIQMIISLIIGYVFSYFLAYVWLPGDEMSGMMFFLVGAVIAAIIMRIIQRDLW